MHIENLGELVAHEQIEEWLVSRPVEVPYLPGAPLRFVFCGLAVDHAPRDFTDAIRSFMSLGLGDRKQAAPYVFKNYRDVVEAIGVDEVGVKIASAAHCRRRGPSFQWRNVNNLALFLAKCC